MPHKRIKTLYCLEDNDKKQFIQNVSSHHPPLRTLYPLEEKAKQFILSQYVIEYYEYQESNGRLTITKYTGSEENVVIPDKINGFPVTAIGDSAFEFRHKLKRVTVPQGVIRIGNYVFDGCPSMDTIILPDSVQTIGRSIFGFYAENVTVYASEKSYAFRYASEHRIKVETGTPAPFMPSVPAISADTAEEPPAAKRPEPDFFYRKNGQEIILIKYIGNRENVIVPSELAGLPVKVIGKSAFSGCTVPVSIVLPESVTTIQKNAFDGCASLTCVTVPASVTAIADDIFGSAANQLTVITPENSMMHQYAEEHDLRTQNPSTEEPPAPEKPDVVIPEEPNDPEKDYRYQPESYGIAITKYTGHEEKVVIPATINKCEVLAIDRFAFNDSKETLKSITIPENVVRIGNMAFFACKKLVHVEFPESLRYITDSAFSCCESLTEISFPDHLDSIGDSAFMNCGMTSVHLPMSVSRIYRGAFSHCSRLQDIHIHNRFFTSCSGILFRADKTALVCYPAGKKDGFVKLNTNTKPTLPCKSTDGHEYTDPYDIPGYQWNSTLLYSVPDGVTEIEGEAFAGNQYLELVALPSSVTKIGYGAFSGCKQLKGLSFDKMPVDTEDWFRFSSVTEIGAWAFSFCLSIENFTIPDGVSEIRSSTFYGCKNLHFMTLPASIKTIEEDAFKDCPKLVIRSVKGSYACQYAEDHQIPVEYSAHVYGDFEYNFVTDDKTEIVITKYTGNKLMAVIPSSIDGVPVTTLGEYVFWKFQPSIVKIPSSVKDCDYNTFYGFKDLTFYVERGSNFCITLTVFTEFDILTFADDPEDFQYKKSSDFIEMIITKYIGTDTSVEIPQLINDIPVKIIDAGAFQDNGTIERVDIPKGVREIKASAFKGCRNLAEIHIPKSVNLVADDAFSGCKKLKIITQKDAPVCQKTLKSGLFSKIEMVIS